MKSLVQNDSLLPLIEEMPEHAKRAIKGGIFGNYVDQFDIFLPVIALAPAAAHLFGPANIARNAGLIFIATLIGRPLGAVIFGPISDRIGRTAATKAAILGVAITTLLISLIPPSFGAFTIFAVLALRLVGGVFIGGEYTSAIPLAMEWTSTRRRGLVSGLIMWMSPWANASIAALVFFLLKALSPSQYDSWGWRIPFLLGATLTFAMFIYYRNYVTDSPTWEVSAKVSNPIKNVLVGGNRKSLWQVFVLMTGMWIFTFMSIAVLTGQLKAEALLTYQGVSLTMMCATAVSAIAMAACGHISTFTGRRKFFILFGIFSTFFAPATYAKIFQHRTLSSLIILVVVLQIVTVSVYGPIAAYLTERFPTSVRSSGYGVAYSMSIVLPAFYPYYLPPLQRIFGNHGAVVLLLTLAGILITVGAWMGPETARTSK